MKNVIFILFLMPIFCSAQSWVEYTLLAKDDKDTTLLTHQGNLLMIGEPDTKGLSVNVFATGTSGWGEILILPTWSKNSRFGFTSFSLGMGGEIGVATPRFGASVFYLKNDWEALFFWEQGSNKWSNNWHLAYFLNEVVNTKNGIYISTGIHSQSGAIHGFRLDFGIRSLGENPADRVKFYLVLGVPEFGIGQSAFLFGLRQYW